LALVDAELFSEVIEAIESEVGSEVADEESLVSLFEKLALIFQNYGAEDLEDCVGESETLDRAFRKLEPDWFDY
jgi:hypothetical protein